MILGVILSMLLILWTFAGTAPQSREDLHELSDGWYLMQDGARVEVPLPPDTVCTDLRYLRPLAGEARL